VVTIRDVARAAGVSIATVSRVFNDSPTVTPATCRRVRSAAGRLDYWPHNGARSLTTRLTHAIGVLLPDLFGEFFSEVIRGIDHTARAERLQILVSSSHADTDAVVAAARSLRGRIDGLIAMVPDRGSAPRVRQIAHRFPVVLLNPPTRIGGCSSVSIANSRGAHAAVTHLVAGGHRDIAILAGPAGNVDADERQRGFCEALVAAGIRPRVDLVIEGDFTEASGYRAVERLLAARPRPSAVFACNDYMAIGLLCALHDAAVAVPDEMAVIGFDDIAMSRYVSPPLTTVRVDAYELGERAARALIARLKAPRAAAAVHAVLPATLVVRRSCGSSRANAADAREGSSSTRRSRSFRS
jgi:LacI family transcriptional regulator